MLFAAMLHGAYCCVFDASASYPSPFYNGMMGWLAVLEWQVPLLDALLLLVLVTLMSVLQCCSNNLKVAFNGIVLFLMLCIFLIELLVCCCR